jgi:Zn-dependent protease with chaperone function
MSAAKTTHLFLFCLICISTAAQVQPVYNFQKDDTVLKKAYYNQALTNKTNLISSLGTEHKKDYSDVYEARFKEVAGLFQSSRSVTDHVADRYLQSLLKKIVAVNPVLKNKEIRLVFTRDWWPNAYSMGEGTLAVNAGLMIFLENEAELAFVICHELAHYYLEHSNKAIRRNIETFHSPAFQNELKRLSKQEYGAGSQLDEMLKKIAFGSKRHSRDNETEADRQAFLFMKNTGFDCEGIKTCLQLFDKVDDSLLYKPVNLEQTFNFTGYPFKKKWIQKESAIFSEMTTNESPLTKKEKDSLKTHPDCAVRISMLDDSIRNAAPGSKFLVDESLFRQLKKDFFIELTEEQFKSLNLGRNLYYSLQMLQSGENIPYAVFAVSRCLNHIYDHQKNHKLGIVTDKETRGYATDYNLLLRMLDRLRLDEIANINYHFSMQYKAQMSGYAGFNEEWNKIVKQKAQY